MSSLLQTGRVKEGETKHGDSKGEVVVALLLPRGVEW